MIQFALRLLFIALLLVVSGHLSNTRARADSGTIEIAPPAEKPQTDPSGKLAIVILKDAFDKALAASTAHRAGQDSWVAINVLIGNPTGLRFEVFPFTGKDIKVALEGVVGEQMLSFAAGGGLRLQIRVAADGKNALYVSPGVDVYVSPPQATYFGHYQTLYYVASDVDVSWVHEISPHFGFELGLKIGAEVGFNEPAYISLNHVAVLPDVSVFTGVRF